MSTKCKHGMDRRFCSLCLQASDAEPLPSNPLMYTNDGNPVLLLRLKPGSRRADVLRLDLENPIIPLDLDNLRSGDTPDTLRKVIIDCFHEFALQKGYLFHPTRALTLREQGEEGPSNCYYCRCKLSWDKGSLGCRQCGYYVCRCGRCLCGYTGKNYRGEVFSQLPPIPVKREERLEFVRVVNYCTSPVEL